MISVGSALIFLLLLVKSFWFDKTVELGSGCDSVGKAVASDIRDPQLEASHWQILFPICCYKSVLKRRK